MILTLQDLAAQVVRNGAGVFIGTSFWKYPGWFRMLYERPIRIPSVKGAAIDWVYLCEHCGTTWDSRIKMLSRSWFGHEQKLQKSPIGQGRFK